MDDQRVDKWKDWLEKGISNDVYSMHLQRDTWKRMHEIVDENESLKGVTSYFWEWLFDIYAKAQAGAVRRQADVNDQAASLGQLIHEIKTTPGLPTRDWYLGHWGEDESYDEDDIRYWRRAGEGVWTDKFGGSVGDHIDPAIAEADLAELRDGSEKVRTYVDKHVAHFDASVIGRGPPSPPERSGGSLPTLNEVHDAIDLIGRLFKKYSGLFSSAEILSLVPVLQHDWEAVFRVQWLPDRELPEPVRLAMESQAERDRETRRVGLRNRRRLGAGRRIQMEAVGLASVIHKGRSIIRFSGDQAAAAIRSIIRAWSRRASAPCLRLSRRPRRKACCLRWGDGRN